MMLERTLVVLGVTGLAASIAHPASPVRETIGFAYALQLLRWHWRRGHLLSPSGDGLIANPRKHTESRVALSLLRYLSAGAPPA